MSSRKTTRTRTSRRVRREITRAQICRLLSKAEKELNKLLKDDQAGTLTRRNLKAGLREIKTTLKVMFPFGGWPYRR